MKASWQVSHVWLLCFNRVRANGVLACCLNILSTLVHASPQAHATGHMVRTDSGGGGGGGVRTLQVPGLADALLVAVEGALLVFSVWSAVHSCCLAAARIADCTSKSTFAVNLFFLLEIRCDT